MHTGTTCRAGNQQGSVFRFTSSVIFLAAILAPALVQAQEISRRPLIECMSTCFLHESVPCTNSVPANQGSPDGTNAAAVSKVHSSHRPSTSGERWEKFEAEFGISQKDPSFIRASMETAKYQLDHTLFGMQEFINDVETAVSFDCELRTLGRQPSSARHSAVSSVPIPWWDTMEKARFQSDIDVNMAGGRAFVGVRLMLPIGN
jgi:hypothetical protein